MTTIEVSPPGPVADPYTEQALSLDLRWWAAANYLTAAQIYLRDNPLLREPLRPEHIKPRLLGHWGTSPGLTMIYTLLNRLIRRTGRAEPHRSMPGDQCDVRQGLDVGHQRRAAAHALRGRPHAGGAGITGVERVDQRGALARDEPGRHLGGRHVDANRPAAARDHLADGPDADDASRLPPHEER